MPGGEGHRDGRRCRARSAVLVALASLAVACGDEAADGPAAGTPTSEQPTAETTTTARDAVTDIDADVGPSVLDLLEGRGRHGTFSVTMAGAESVSGPHTYTGRYVRTSDGGTYTVADLDLALVEGEVQRLLAMHDRFDTLDPLFTSAVLSADTVVTDQLQLGLADLLMRAGFIGEEGVLALEPSLAFTALEANPLEPCQEALTALRAAVERRVAEEASQLGRSWAPDAGRLGASERDAVALACDGIEDVDLARIALQVDDLSVSVVVDDDPVLSITVQPGDGDAPAVDTIRPAPLLDRFGVYFLAIDRCGGLPWLYSNFAAANSYTSPDEATYIGPTPFEGEAVCADEVPDGR